MKYILYLILIPVLLTAQDPSTFDTVKVNKFITPTKFDHFLYGHETEVKWQKLPDYDRYKLSLSPDGDRWWLTSDSIVGNTYQWEISDMNCDSCQWKVEPYMDEDTRFLKHEWTRTPEPAIKHIEPINLLNTGDSNMILVGYKRVYSENTKKDQTDFYVAKFSNEAELIWEFEYGDLDSNDTAEGILETEEGDFIVVGTTESTEQGVKLFGKKDIVAVKLDKDGNRIWRQTYGGKENDWGFRILPAKDGGYFIGGQTASSDRYFKKNEGQVDYFIMKIDSEGYMEWSETYGREKDEVLDDMQLDPDGNIILFGFSDSRDSVYMSNKYGTWTDKTHPWIVKVDSLGTKIWDYQHAIGDDYNGNMSVIKDGSILLFIQSSNWASEYINSNPNTYWAVKLDKNKNIEYVKEYTKGHALNNRKQFENSRGNITQSLGSSILEIETSSKIVWYRKLNEGIYIPKSMIETKDHSMIVVGLNEPRELTFQKYTVSPLAIPEFSDYFSVETSQPTFTKDTIWFPLKYISITTDTLLTDLICNKGSITGDLDDYHFVNYNSNIHKIVKIESDDKYIEPNECVDIVLENKARKIGTNITDIYFSRPYQSNTKYGNKLTVVSQVTDLAIFSDTKYIDFGSVEIGDTSEALPLKARNISNRNIQLFNFSHVDDDFIITYSFEIPPHSEKSIYIKFSPLDSGLIESNYSFYYKPNQSEEEKYIGVKLKGTGIPKKETSVNETEEQEQTTYPNPATNIGNLSDYAEKTVYIYDITGKQVSAADVESGRIDISDLTAGVYFLKGSNAEVVGKFVKVE